jgi:hypothetical protein
VGAPYAPPPRKIPYEDGDPIPPGYVLETSIKQGLVIAGATTLGPLWITSMIGGAIAIDNHSGSEFWPLFIPAVGPFIAIGTHDASATSGLLLAIDGLGQTAGLTMLICGLALENKFLRYRGAALELGPKVQVGVDGNTTFGVSGSF